MERIFAKRTIREFWEKHAETEQYLKTWYDIVRTADWKNSAEIKQVFANASILKEGRVVFNFKGNDYRLVARINFEKQWVFIRFIGTHADYDRIDANTV